MKEIQLTMGKKTRVDNEDYEKLSIYKWHVNIAAGGRLYAARSIFNGGKILMHREIMSPKIGEEVDHIDGNGLNNGRSNLRLATRKENARNAKIKTNNTSGYTGVHWHKKRQRWQALIMLNGRRKWLGNFTKVDDAAEAYKNVAKTHYGKFYSEPRF